MKKLIGCIALAIMLVACSKTELPEPSNQGPFVLGKGGGTSTSLTVTTVKVFMPSAIQATAQGNVSGANSQTLTGFCYSTSSNPSINDNVVYVGTGNGDYTSVIQGLTPGTTYYFRAFAKKKSSVYYGNIISYTTLTLGMPSPGIGTVTFDGDVYNTITLAGKVWMVENLKSTHYRNGDPIQNLTSNTAWSNASTGAYCDYDNNPANGSAYGRLYNKYAVMDPRNLAPPGWHVATPQETLDLLDFLGGYGVAGGRLKESGYSHWDSPNAGADNSSVFTAVGAGWRNGLGSFMALNQQMYLWNTSSTMTEWRLDYNSASYYINTYGCPSCFKYGYSVRCVKD